MCRAGERNREDDLPRVEVAIEFDARGVWGARITIFAGPDGYGVVNELDDAAIA